MRALIRNEGETVRECDGIEGIDWDTGAPLTNEVWYGGPYTLVQNYIPPKNDEPAQYEEVPRTEEVVEDDDYVVIDGVRYSKEELRSLIE